MALPILIGLALFVSLLFWGVSRGQSSPPPPAKDGQEITVERMASLSPGQIDGELSLLAQKAPPESAPPFVAMCYVAMDVRENFQYLCPVCSTKTVYSEEELGLTMADIVAFRREVEQLRETTHWQIRLDESRLCKHCDPRSARRGLGLRVAYQDGTEHTSFPVVLSDLVILKDFLEGRLTPESPSWNAQLPRLREVIGVGLPRRP